MYCTLSDLEFTDYRYHPILHALPDVDVPPLFESRKYNFSLFSVSSPPLNMYKWRDFDKYFPSEPSSAYLPAPKRRMIPHARIHFYEIPNASTWDPAIYNAAVYSMRQMILPKCSNTHVLSPSDSLKEMELGKSNGLLWSNFLKDVDGKPTKLIVFETCPDMFPNWWEQAGKGRFPLTVKSSYLKQEILLAEKARTFKTRLFIPDDLLNLAMHQSVSHEFNKKLYTHAVFPETWSGLGWCKFYGNADKLYNMMPEKVIVGDTSQQDASEHANLLWTHAETIRLSWAKSHDTIENRRRLAFVYANIIYPLVVLPDGTAYKKRRGNCSGQLRTSADNTFTMIVILSYDLLKNGFCPLDHLDMFISIIQGDDLLVNATITSACSLQETFAMFGKRLKARECLKKDSTFCSHVWMPKECSSGQTRWILCLPRERLACALKWYKKKINYNLTCERLAGLSIEAYPYDDLFDKIRDALDALNAPSCFYLSRDQLEGLWFGLESNTKAPSWARGYCESKNNLSQYV